MKGKNGILLLVEFLKGLLEDRKCRLKICNTRKPQRRNGSRKWKTKNLFNVGLWTQYPPQSHSTKDGNGDNKFVITVAPQKLICPKGKT